MATSAPRASLSSEHKLNQGVDQTMSLFLIDSLLTQTGAPKRTQHRTQSGVTSPGAKDRLPSKPLICRTMTTGRPAHQQDSQKQKQQKQKHFFILDSQARTITNPRRPTALRCTSALFNEQIQNRRGSSSSAFKPVITFSSPLSPKEQKMSEHIQKENNNMVSTFKLANQLSEEDCQRRGSSNIGPDTEVCPNHYTSSLSPHPSKTYYHSTGHRWTFGMTVLILVIISTFSASSMVMCVPLGLQNGGGDGRGGDFGSSSSSLSAQTTHRNGLMIPTSRVWGLERNENQMDEQAPPYSLLSKGQIYLPSLLNNAPVKAGEYSNDGGAFSNEGSEGGLTINKEHQQSNYHLQQLQQNSEGGNPFKHSAHIQKPLNQQQKDDSQRNVKSDDEDDGDDDAATPTRLHEYDDNNQAGQAESEWETVIDPHLYVLTEWDSPPYQEKFPLLQQQRKRRNSGTGPSLSIVNPLDVLRQRLLLEIARRRMRQSHNQIIANEEILRKIGRRRR